MKKVYTMFAVFMCLWIEGLVAQVPQMIHYQGRIVAGATNFEGAGFFKFALVSTNGAGSVITVWSNNGSSVDGSEPSAAVNIPVVRGLYSVLLGDTAMPNMQKVSPDAFSRSFLYLRVWFSDGVTGFQRITPDQRLSSVGYAMVAESVPDAAITPVKLAPGIPGQVMMTDDNGRVNWSPAASVVNHAVVDDPDAVAVADPDENTALIVIEGLFTNEVVVCGSIWMELDTALYPGLNADHDSGGFVWEVPSRSRVNEYSKFIFEYAGAAVESLIAETNAYPRVGRDVTLIIRNALNVEQCRWTLPKLEIQRVLVGSGGRTRFVCAPSPENMYMHYNKDYVAYTREPRVVNHYAALYAGYDDWFVEVEGGVQCAPTDFKVDIRTRTVTLTLAATELGHMYDWFSSTAGMQLGTDMELRAMSTIKVKRLTDGGVTEIYRNNYYECVPVRYEIVTGFGRFEKLRERVVIKYVFRQRG